MQDNKCLNICPINYPRSVNYLSDMGDDLFLDLFEFRMLPLSMSIAIFVEW